jgi:hypothetical protein
MALAERMGGNIGAIDSSVALGRAALAEADLLSGRPDRVIADLEPLLDGLAGAALGRTTILPCLAWAYLDAGNPDRATALLEDGRAHAQAQSNQLALMEMLLVQARVAIRRQQWATVHSTLESAIALSRTMRSPYAEARALHIYGLLHTKQGEPDVARARLGDALTILQRLGERLYAERIEQALADIPSC